MQDQWSKKKQTKQQAADARRGKLDPDSERNRNAKEVLDERAKNKRKLREMEKHDDTDNEDDWEDQEPIPGLYACGELVGGIFYFSYPGGSGLINGAVFGRLAGATAVADLRSNAGGGMAPPVAAAE